MSKLHPAIKVASCQEGFRRAGYTFGTKPKTIALAALHPHAYAAIREDQSLVVVDTAIALNQEEAAALAHADAPHVIAAQANACAYVPDVSENTQRETLASLEAELNARAKQITTQEAELQRKAAQLDAREGELLAREEALKSSSDATPAALKHAKASGK